MAKIIKRKAITEVEITSKDKIDVNQIIDQSFNNVSILKSESFINGDIFIKFTHDIEIDMAK